MSSPAAPDWEDGMEEGARAPERRSRGKLWIWLAVGAVFLVAFTGLALYFTGEPEFCRSCHEMEPAVDGWRAGTHAEVSCFDCHSDPGIIGYLEAHVGDGLRDVWVHFTERPERVQDSNVPIPRCLACHEEAFAEDSVELPQDHPPKTEYCPECHRESIHGEAP